MASSKIARVASAISLPLRLRKLVAAFGRVDLSDVQDFRRVQIADSGNSLLVEQRDLHRAFARAETFAEQFGGHGQGIGAEFDAGQTLFRTRRAKLGEHFRARGGPNRAIR